MNVIARALMNIFFSLLEWAGRVGYHFGYICICTYIHSIFTFHMDQQVVLPFTIPNGSRYQITILIMKRKFEPKMTNTYNDNNGQIANMQTIRVSQTVEYNLLILDILTVRAWERHSLPFCSQKSARIFITFHEQCIRWAHKRTHNTQPWTNHNILCYRRYKKSCL